MRNEIEGMATQLADEVPSDVEDVDKDFDDESNRWFAREFYAVKHETTLINRMRDDRKQKNGVVKLLKLNSHNTTYSTHTNIG